MLYPQKVSLSGINVIAYFFVESAVISPSPFSIDFYRKLSIGRVAPSEIRLEGKGVLY
tara:strand:+ start:1289 stop:1462 length:174 start_codon:yes stop_codon:yes gene_type:complete